MNAEEIEKRRTELREILVLPYPSDGPDSNIQIWNYEWDKALREMQALRRTEQDLER